MGNERTHEMTEESRDWRRISRGVFWIGIGIFLLLNTLDMLRWSLWLEAVAYWPVLLVALGVRLLFDHSKAPALVLLSPALVLATLGWVAANGVPGPPGEWSPLAAERPEDTSRWELTGGLGMARLSLRAAPVAETNLIEGRVASRRDTGLDVSPRDGEARVRLRQHDREWGVVLPPPSREHWDLAVARDLPLEIDLELGFVDADLDLAETTVVRAQIDGAFNDVELRLGEPETDVRLVFEGAFNVLEVIVPPETPTRVRTDGFMNVLSRKRSTESLTGPGYRIHVEGAFNRLRVRSE